MSKIARGIVAGVDTGIHLSAKQCVEMGSHAMGKDYYYQAITWMEAAVSKIVSEKDTTANLTESEMQLETAKEVVSAATRFANQPPAAIWLLIANKLL